MKFSLRDILLLMAIVALALGWWFDRRSGARRFEMHATENHAYVLDTVTGEVWEGSVNQHGYLSDKSIKGAKLPE